MQKLNYMCIKFVMLQVSLWQENVEGEWICLSDLNKGQSNVKDK